MNRDDQHLAAQTINARNAATTRRAEAAAGFVVALLVAILGALALVHWWTCGPADGSALCMAAVIPTRTTPWGRAYRRLRGALHAAWLRYLIGAAEGDLAWQQQQLDIATWELQAIPRQCERTRLHIDALRVRLISAELDARGA